MCRVGSEGILENVVQPPAFMLVYLFVVNMSRFCFKLVHVPVGFKLVCFNASQNDILQCRLSVPVSGTDDV